MMIMMILPHRLLHCTGKKAAICLDKTWWIPGSWRILIGPVHERMMKGWKSRLILMICGTVQVSGSINRTTWGSQIRNTMGEIPKHSRLPSQDLLSKKTASKVNPTLDDGYMMIHWMHGRQSWPMDQWWWFPQLGTPGNATDRKRERRTLPINLHMDAFPCERIVFSEGGEMTWFDSRHWRYTTLYYRTTLDSHFQSYESIANLVSFHGTLYDR